MSSASRGLMESITATTPTSTTESATNVINPWDSKSLITATSLMTREIVTPAMCVS